jgi:hypothetical protein
MAEPRSPAEGLIVGGALAALETSMALRDVAGPRRRVVDDFDAGLVGALAWR